MEGEEESVNRWPPHRGEYRRVNPSAGAALHDYHPFTGIGGPAEKKPGSKEPGSGMAT